MQCAHRVNTDDTFFSFSNEQIIHCEMKRKAKFRETQKKKKLNQLTCEITSTRTQFENKTDWITGGTVKYKKIYEVYGVYEDPTSCLVSVIYDNWWLCRDPHVCQRTCVGLLTVLVMFRLKNGQYWQP